MQDQYEKNRRWMTIQQRQHELEYQRQQTETKFIAAIGGILLLGVLVGMWLLP